MTSSSVAPRVQDLHFRTVVFPTDGWAWAEHAFAQAVFYAATHDATLHVLTVTPGSPTPSRGTTAGCSSAAFRARLCDAADAVAVVQEGISADRPESGIIQYAERVGADLIVMSTNGRAGLDLLLNGSATESVIRRARCPVLTVRPTASSTALVAGRVRRILVPADFSAASYRALAHAVVLARLHGAALYLVYVVEPPPEVWIGGEVIGWDENSPRRVDEARAALRGLTDAAGVCDIPLTLHTLMGPPARGVLEAAERLEADLIVMGTHGRTGARRLLVGSVVEKVVRCAPCPVYVVSPSETTRRPTAAGEHEAVSD